ncbi:MAG: hypothetical protein DPW09_03600 [Anaerolineae bacterium]|nr:hypothetical protein [Anaerolineae bacterium]
MRPLFVWSIIAVVAIVMVAFCVSLINISGTSEAIMIGLLTGIATGIATGIFTSFTVGLFLFFDQFSFSLAGYCVNETVAATKEIPKLKERAEARDKYRYSLGVIIDEFNKVWRNNRFREDEWPRLVHFKFKDGQPYLANEKNEFDPNADRWAFFNEYIKPVRENINSFSFLGRQYLDVAHIFGKGSEIRKLTALTELCNKLRTVVSELDAAYESNLVKMVKVNNDEVVIQPASDEDPQAIERLRTAYRELHKAWVEWLRIVNLV